MRLNLDIIHEQLPKRFQAKRYGPPNRTCAYERPLVYEGGEAFEKGNLYMAPAEALPKNLPPKGCAVIAVGARVPREWLLGGAELLVVSNADSVMQLFNVVQTIYNSYDRWDAQLRDELEKDFDFDLRRILELGVRQLKKTIGVSDHTLRSIFRTEIAGDPGGEPEVRILSEPHYLDLEFGEMVKEVCNLERIITVPYITAVETFGCHYYCYNLYPIGTFSGCVAISDGGTPFREGEFPLMDHFFTHFQKAFVKYLYSYGQEEHSGLTVVHKLLNQQRLTQEEAQVLDLQSGERWCCFRLKERRNGKTFPKDYMYAMLSALMPRTVYAVLYHEEIVGLMRLRGTGEEDTCGVFSRYLQRLGYYGGVSNSFRDLGRLHMYLRQATYAAERGGDPDRSLFSFEDYALDWMLGACVGELPSETLLSGGLLALQNHDRQKGTEYLKTLDAYLKNEMSATQTAQALFIHRSSLIKRLDKIQRLLGSDLSDPDERLYYRICLALLEKEL